MSERCAGLETGNAEADPPLIRGRLPSAGKRATSALADSAGVLAAARMQEGSGRNTGSPVGGVARANRTPARGRPGRSGWREGPGVARSPGNAGGAKGPQFESGVGRRTGHGDWREPISPAKRSETPEGATCESEGISGLSVLLAVRQGVAGRCVGGCLAGGAPQRRCGRGGRPDGRGHRGVRCGPVAWGIGAGPEGGDLPAGCGSTGSHSQEAAREVSALGHSLHTGPGGADGGDVGAVADLRSGPWHRSNTPIVRVGAHTMLSSARIDC